MVLSQALTFSGQAMDGMTRDKGWRFLDMGRRLERAADLSDLIRYALVRPVPDEDARLHALLEVANSAMTYRSRYVFGPDPAPVLDLLLADEANPRSVAFQLATLYQHVRGLPAKREPPTKEQRIVDGVVLRHAADRRRCPGRPPASAAAGRACRWFSSGSREQWKYSRTRSRGRT